jgi:hypothetical protein
MWKTVGREGQVRPTVDKVIAAMGKARAFKGRAPGRPPIHAQDGREKSSPAQAGVPSANVQANGQFNVRLEDAGGPIKATP